jgi:hypothetical protein
MTDYFDRFSAPLHREEVDYSDEYREQDDDYIAESWDRFDHLINTY